MFPCYVAASSLVCCMSHRARATTISTQATSDRVATTDTSTSTSIFLNDIRSSSIKPNFRQRSLSSLHKSISDMKQEVNRPTSESVTFQDVSVSTLKPSEMVGNIEDTNIKEKKLKAIVENETDESSSVGESNGSIVDIESFSSDITMCSQDNNEVDETKQETVKRELLSKFAASQRDDVSIPSRPTVRMSTVYVHPKLLEKVCEEWVDSLPWKV